MKNIDSLRTMTSMIIHAFEDNLSNFIIKRGINYKSEILSKYKLKISQSRETDDIEIIVNQLFTQDLFDIALNITSNDKEKKSLQNLFNLSKQLKLYEVRNAVAHANRKFIRQFGSIF